MNIATETREILRQYKALINARRRDAGQRELTTAQVMDEICEYMTCLQSGRAEYALDGRFCDPWRPAVLRCS